MRNIELPDDFRLTGGTEFAPLSTSSGLKVRGERHSIWDTHEKRVRYTAGT
jgi:hypothetical protein